MQVEPLAALPRRRRACAHARRVTFRRGDRDQLDLVELVLAEHAARVAAGRARLGAEARRQRGEAERQLGLVEDGFADEVGQRDFGGGDEPERWSDCALELLPIEHATFRSIVELHLASERHLLAAPALGIEQILSRHSHSVATRRRTDLRRTSAAAPSRTAPRRAPAAAAAPRCSRARVVCRSSMNWPSARSSRASCPLSTTKRAPESLAAVSKSICPAPRRARSAPSALFDGRASSPQSRYSTLACSSAPDRHVVERHVGDHRQRVVQRLVAALPFASASRAGTSLSSRDFGHQLRGRRLVLLRLGLADLLGGRVAPRLRLLERQDARRAAPRRARSAGRHRRPTRVSSATSSAGFRESTDVEHRCGFLRRQLAARVP